MPSKKRLKLYWCSTNDHDEDWFVVAHSAREAKRFHEDEESYGRGDANSILIAIVPEKLHGLGWPTRELLVACGGTINRWKTPRVVTFQGMRYAEGMMDHEIDQLSDDISEKRGRGRPNETEAQRKN
jgi:hypothetical protein